METDGDDRTKAGGLEEPENRAEADDTAEPHKSCADPERTALTHPEIKWGPLPGGSFRFTDHPTAEEFRAYAEWDPNIREKVREKFLDLVRCRARDDAIRDVYNRVLPEPPELPREPLPRTPGEVARALSRFVSDTQEAVDHLLALGRNPHNDMGPRIRALTAVARSGPAAAQLGAAIDRLWRAAGVPREDDTVEGDEP